MRKALLITVLTILNYACSSSDDSTKSVPESFDIRIEVSGLYTIPRVHVSVNSSVVKEWENQDLPFNSNYTYFTTGSEITNTACECIKISASAYVSDINEMESFKLYIDGDLVGSTSITPQAHSDGTINPARIEFIYNP